MPLHDKIRIATCSATRFCLSRGHPLRPRLAYRHAERKFGANIVTDDGIFGAVIVTFFENLIKKESLYGR